VLFGYTEKNTRRFETMDGTEKYIETVKYLGKLYDFLDEKFFNGELKKPVITIQRDERNKSNGWWSLKKVWKWTEKVPANCAECETIEDCKTYIPSECYQFKEREGYELNMTAQQLNRPIDQIAATMLHEMCHQYATMNDMKDTSRSGVYHNKLFKHIAEQHGLTVSYIQAIGWSGTQLTIDSLQLIKTFVADTPADVIYREAVFKGQTVKSSSTRKYICPCCGQSVRATKEVRIVCADCNEFMREES
jgi:hypothetical protein